jgi:hypothetical protein
LMAKLYCQLQHKNRGASPYFLQQYQGVSGRGASVAKALKSHIKIAIALLKHVRYK